ncbi:MAG: PSD1 and planctomycete cytochrome C domain-containing protein [Verrucomicrobiales bacterium]
MVSTFLKSGFAFFLLFAVADKAGAEVDFSRDIRPLLSDRCFKCHGYDDATREADLGLHLFAEATRDLGGYRAVEPGRPEESEILARLAADDPDDAMPPPSANKPRFSEDEIALIREWIDQGANYDKHWAFVPPTKPAVPESPANSDHPIDRFIDGKIEENGLEASGRADPRTLIRRLSYDLRGLPPTIEETDRFVEAHGKDRQAAWESLIERFLASPAYGERWAREWLDLARYADTNGYEKDRPRSIWPYRDWVVRALNDDMPYDRFTIEQLAGDMLPDPTTDQLVATGFHRNTMLNEEGGIDPLEFRYHAMVDRVATTGSVWMGLTTGCAQCHTHKFDPILHTDYFAMMALLNNADERDIVVPVPDLVDERATIERRMEAMEERTVSRIDETEYGEWLEERRREAVEWIPLRAAALKANLPHLQIVEEDLSIFASGDFTKRDVYEIMFDAGPVENPVTAIRIEAIPDERLPGGGPGTAFYEGRKGDFFLSEVEVEADGEKIAVKDASVSFGKLSVGSGDSGGMNTFDGDGSTGWSTSTREGERNELVINLASPLAEVEELGLTLLFERHFVAALGRFRVSVTTDQRKVAASDPAIPNPRQVDDAAMRRAYVRAAPPFEEEQRALAALEEKLPELPTTPVFRERPPENPRVTHRHHRGEYLQPKETVEPAVPAFLEPIREDEPKNRLGFARWLVSERNPLAARVAANRAWRAFFGTGIVRTSGDFGFQSESPSHPELIDWLAVHLVENGWSMKQLHRHIVTSEVYRRDSAVGSAGLSRDPGNRLLARGPRFRLTGEMIRDGALAATGLLSEKIGGPGVYPPQPASVVELAYGKQTWTPSTGEDRHRRSLYTFAKRTAPFAAYLTFDGPTGESCLPRRERSNTPLQALVLLNDAMFGEAAEALARQTVSDPGGNPVAPSGTLEEMFRRVLARPPTEGETRDFLAFFEKQRKRLASDELEAAAMLDGGNPSPELASWKMVARVLLNLNETITKG